MNECPNCGARNEYDNYNCNECNYPILGTYEERAKFSMSGGGWKAALDSKEVDVDIEQQKRKILFGRYTILVMAISHLTLAILFAFGIRAGMVRSQDAHIMATILGVFALTQFATFFGKKDSGLDSLTIVIVVRSVSVLAGLVYLFTYLHMIYIGWLFLWFLFEGFGFMFLGRAYDAYVKIRSWSKENRL